MKKLMNAIDSFCYRHPRFGIPNLMLYIVIANAVFWAVSLMDRSGMFVSALSFSPYHILRGQVWRLFTFALLPYNYSWLALIAFYFYYFIGSNIEREWGSGKFTVYVLSGVVLTVIYGFVLYFVFGAIYPNETKEYLSLYIGNFVSAYYIYLSMFFTFATLWPDMQVLLFFILPVKMKWLGLLDAALFLYDVLRIQPFAFKLLPLVAVLNYLLFCGDWLFASFRPAARRQRRNTVNFRSEVRRMQYEQQQKPYNNHCSKH